MLRIIFFNNDANGFNRKCMNKNNNKIINENEENVNAINIMNNNYTHSNFQKYHKEFIGKR